MEKRNESSKKLWQRLMAAFLVVVFILGMVLTMRAQIRFSGLNYVGQVAEYAAHLTEDNTAYLSRGTLDRAWTILRSTVRRPRSYEDYDMYASLAIAREDYETAVPYMRGCVDTYDGGDNKELAMLNLRLASLYVLQEDYTAGVEALDRAIELDGTLAPAWFLRAELQLTLGDAAAAVEDLGVYRTLESSDAVILASLGSLYETTGDLEAAVECYSAGLADQRSYSVDLLCDRARCLVLLGRLDEARQDLDSYFARDGEDPDGEAAAMLAVCRMNDEDYAGAYEMFHRALRDGYATPYLLYSQSVLCAYLCGDYAAAIHDGEKAIALAEENGENSGELHFWVGLAGLVSGDYAAADVHLQQASDLRADLADLSYYRGVSALAQGEIEAAIAYFTDSAERGESITQSLYDRAVCYLALENIEEAAADLRTVIERGDEQELSAKAEELLAGF